MFIGLLIRRKRALKFTPSGLSTLFEWLDPGTGTLQEITGTSATTPATVDGNPIGTWKGSKGKYFVAPATVNRPLIKTNRLNGKSLVLGGNSLKLMLTDGIQTNFTTLQVAVVCEAAVSSGGTQNIFEFRDNAIGNSIFEIFKANADTTWTGRSRDNGGLNLITTLSTNTNLAIYELDWDGTNQRTWQGGTLASGPTGRTGTISLQKYTYLNHCLDLTSWLNCAVGDMVIYTGTRDVRVYNYLKSKYGL